MGCVSTDKCKRTWVAWSHQRNISCQSKAILLLRGGNRGSVSQINLGDRGQQVWRVMWRSMTHLSHRSSAVKSRHYPFSGMKWKWNERKCYQDYGWKWRAGRWKSDVKKREREVEERGHVAVIRTKGWKEERECARATATSSLVLITPKSLLQGDRDDHFHLEFAPWTVGFGTHTVPPLIYI